MAQPIAPLTLPWVWVIHEFEHFSSKQIEGEEQRDNSHWSRREVNTSAFLTRSQRRQL
jgi:hypothetical protein